eukprot:s1917_g10.t1
MPEAMSSQISVNIQNLDVTIPDVLSFSRGVRVQSPLVGPADSFQCRLHIYPAGRDESARKLSTFVAVVPPKHLQDGWSCPDVKCSIWIPGIGGTVSWVQNFTFCRKASSRGWINPLNGKPLRDFLNSNGELRVQAQVSNLPYVHPPPEPSKPLFPDLDLSVETKMLSFRLAEGASLFFDQRLLMARSEYFQKMLKPDEWQESNHASYPPLHPDRFFSSWICGVQSGSAEVG